MGGWSTDYSRPWDAASQCRVRHRVTQYNSIFITNWNSLPIYPYASGACVMSLDITWGCVWFCKNNSNFCTSQDSQTQLYSQVCFALNSQCSSFIVRNEGYTPQSQERKCTKSILYNICFYIWLLMDLFITNKKSPFTFLLLSIVSSLTTYCPGL